MKALLIALSILLVGCTTDRTVPLEAAQTAQYPQKPADFRDATKQYLLTELKDPMSAQYSGWRLMRCYVGANPPVYGWLISVNVNAKNGFGAYTGSQPRHFSFEGGRIIPINYLDNGSEAFMPHKFHIVDVAEQYP